MTDRPRPRGNRLRDLDGWRRWACTAAIAVFGLLPVAVAARVASQGWHATGDVAIIGLRSLDAWTGRAPLVGQPTTGEEFSGVPSNHPGPIVNWTLGPVMRLLGVDAGLLVGVAIVNGASLALSLWLGLRRGGPALLAIVAVMLALLVVALGPGVLIDAFNPEISTFPAIAALLAAWAVLAGDLAVVPAFVVATSFAAQPHVAGATLIAPVVLMVAIALVVRARRHPRRFRAARASLLAGGALAFVCWLPPLVQELRGPSNVAALVRTQRAGGPSLGLAYIGERIVTAIAPIPIWAHPTGSYGFVADRGPIGVLLAALVLGGAGSLALHLRSGRNLRAPTLLYGVAVATAVASAAIWQGTPPISAFRIDSFRWLWVTSLVVWLALIWSSWLHLPSRVRSQAGHVAPAIAAAASAVLLLWAVPTTHLSDLRDHRFMAATDRLATTTIEQLPAGRYRMRFDGAESLVTVGPGLALRLEDAGRQITVDDGPFGRAYGTSRTEGTAPTEGTVLVANGSPELGAGDRLLATDTVHDASGDPVTISVVLER